MLPLKGKVALVTGAKKGIGKAIALKLAQEGADMIINDLDVCETDEIIEVIKVVDRRVMAIAADITQKGQVARMVKAALDFYRRIDILINTAGIYPNSPLLEIQEEQWDAVIDVNLKGTFLVTQAVAKFAMVKQNYGRIVNITSADGKNPSSGITHYAAAKAGVISLNRSFAIELAPYNIMSNAVAPGWVETEAVLKGDRWREAVKKIPAQRLGRLDEITEAVCFLASDAASYVNGATLNVNGGLIMD
jgi:NAD(P)-dependent dehydrogenase (short-subunit alcohol dehydrogenase family)